MKVFESPIILAAHKDQCLLTAPACIGTINIPYIDCEALEEKNYMSKGRSAVAIDSQMVGCGTDGSLDLLARVCLVDEEENTIFHTYVQPQITVTDYRMSNLPIKPRMNVIAFLNTRNERASDYVDCLEWLRKSPIHYAISVKPNICKANIVDFWRSATVNYTTDPTTIHAKVQGEDLSFTATDVSRILQLQDDTGDTVELSESEVDDGFRRMGYEGPSFSKKSEFVKSFLSPEWRYIAHVFIMCLSNRKGGIDGMGLEWGKAMVLVCEGKKANLAHLIFNSLAENCNASQATKWILYPRFLQLILNDLKPNLRVIGDFLELKHVTQRIFLDCKATPLTFSGKKTYLWRNMYSEERWKYIEAKIEQQKKNENEPAQQATDAIKKRKRIFRDKTKEFEEQLEEEHEEVQSIKKAKKEKERAEKEKRTKGKQAVIGETSRRPRPTTRSLISDEIIRIVEDLVSEDLEVLKEDLHKMKKREKKKDKIIIKLVNEITELRKTVLHQNDQIKLLLKKVH